MFHRLGQHFLINKTAIKKIIAALDLQPNDVVIEIGPGKGALTIPLAEECQNLKCKIIAIEKDTQLVERLKVQGLRKNLKIIQGDILKILPELPYTLHLTPYTYKIVGNIPYYITGKLLRILSELKNKPELIVLMLQKEVAKRIIAKPPKMNLLAAAVQFWAEPKILFSLKPEDFSPPPKVNSAVISLTPIHADFTQINADKYYWLIKILFKQPRKTILNNLLKSDFNRLEIENELKKLKIDPQSRPQNLSVEQIKKLTFLLLTLV